MAQQRASLRLLNPLPFQSFPKTPSLGHWISSCAVDPLSECLVASLAAAENLNGTAGLKPEPSVYHSRLDALDCCDGDHSSESCRIGRDMRREGPRLPT